ncbi:hypothetical protein BU17DRAFT_69273, partial [Hysterangium stoloniferum]
ASTTNVSTSTSSSGEVKIAVDVQGGQPITAPPAAVASTDGIGFKLESRASGGVDVKGPVDGLREEGPSMGASTTNVNTSISGGVEAKTGGEGGMNQRRVRDAQEHASGPGEKLEPDELVGVQTMGGGSEGHGEGTSITDAFVPNVRPNTSGGVGSGVGEHSTEGDPTVIAGYGTSGVVEPKHGVEGRPGTGVKSPIDMKGSPTHQHKGTTKPKCAVKGCQGGTECKHGDHRARCKVHGEHCKHGGACRDEEDGTCCLH